MLGEFDGEPLKRRSVQTLQKALDDELRAQIEPGDLLDDFGAQVLFGFFHGFGRARTRMRSSVITEK